MQITVFHCVHKEIDNAFSPGEWFANYILRLLSSSLGNTVLLHTFFLEYKTQIGEKNTGQCFLIELQFTCISSDKSEKNQKPAKIRHRLVISSALQLQAKQGLLALTSY